MREAARIELGMRAFLNDGGFKGFTTTFEDLHGLEQLPGLAVQRLMADGYGFGAEGDWKTAALVRAVKVMADGPAGRRVVHGGLHLPPRSGQQCWCSARICWRSAHRIADRQAVAGSPSAGHRRQDGSRPGWCSTRRRARRSTPRMIDMGNRFRLLINEVDVVAPEQPMPKLPVAQAVWKPRPNL